MVLTYIGTTFELANYEYWKISLDLLLVAWDANCLAMTDWVLAHNAYSWSCCRFCSVRSFVSSITRWHTRSASSLRFFLAVRLLGLQCPLKPTFLSAKFLNFRYLHTLGFQYSYVPPISILVSASRRIRWWFKLDGDSV